MGRSGGGGGGRSGGGGFSGGGRSSGGFSGGSSHRSSSSFGRSSFGGSSMGHRPPPPPRSSYRPHTTVVHNTVNNYGPSYGGSGGFGGFGGNGYYSQQTTSRTSVVGFMLSIVVVLLIFCVAISLMFSGGDSGIAKSTVEREALSMSRSQETDYFYDEAGWISNRSKLEKGLKYFYKETGVQPYVYITDGSKGRDVDSLNAFAVEEYDRLFTDEAHFILVLYDNGVGNYYCGYCVGSEAKTVIDSEAIGILADYLDRYYNDNTISDEEFFSNSFEKTADRIMTVTKSPLPKIFAIIGVVVIVLIAFVWWGKAKEQKNKEAEQTERILNSDLHTFGSGVDPKLSDLEDKYSD